MYKIKHNTNLNVLVDTINKIIHKNQSQVRFDRNNLIVTLRAKELDKFSNADEVLQDFSVNICYSLLGN